MGGLEDTQARFRRDRGQARGGLHGVPLEALISLLLLLIPGSLGACARVAGGEFSPSACSDDVDNDGDDDIDCEDADCRGLNVCAPTVLLGVDQAPRERPDPPDQGVTSLFGESTYQHLDDDAKMPDPDDDAGFDSTPADPCVPNPCTATERCLAGVCVATPDAGPENDPGNVVAVFIAAADIPVLRDTNLACLEPDCTLLNCYCRRLPDPYAELRLNDVVVGRTPTRMDDIAPTWDEPAFEVEYLPGDQLEVRLIDEDGTAEVRAGTVIDDAEDDLMWQCPLKPPSRGTLVYSCAGPAGSDGTNTLSVLMTVRSE